MSTKGFVLLMITVIIIGGSIGGAFAGGLALGRSQSDDAAPETALFQQRFGGGQFSADGLPGGRLPGSDSTGGALPGGQFGGQTSAGDTQTGGDAAPSFGGGGFGDRGGPGGGFSRNVLNGTIGTVDGNLISVATDSGEINVNLSDDSTIQLYQAGTAGDLSLGDRVLIIVSGDVGSGETVDAASVIVNPPGIGGAFGSGGFGGRGGFGGGAFPGILIGTVGDIDGNRITVVTESGETQVNLGDDLAIQIYEAGTIGDLTPGDLVSVVVTGDVESGEPVVAASVTINPPEGGGIFGAGGFGAGGFGGRPPRP